MVEDHFDPVLQPVALESATRIPHDVTHRVVDQRLHAVFFDASPCQRIVETRRTIVNDDVIRPVIH